MWVLCSGGLFYLCIWGCMGQDGNDDDDDDEDVCVCERDVFSATPKKKLNNINMFWIGDKISSK